MPDTPAPLSARARALPEAEIIRMAQRGRDLAAQGRDVVNLTVGQPDFDTPDHIKQAGKKALDDGITKYTPVPGTPAIREAIAEKFDTENNIACTPDQIVVSNGAKQSILNVCLALLNPGDEVILQAPYWASYLGLIALAEARPVVVQTSVEENFKASAQRLEGAITDKTRLIILNTPSNPSGAVQTAQELSDIARMLARHDRVFALSDEIYEYINFAGGHASLAAASADLQDRVITVNGFSKGFAMTGWRLGYMAAPQWLAQICTRIQANVTSGASSIAQAAGVAALHGPRDAVAEMTASYMARRDLVAEGLTALPGVKLAVPDGTFYVFPDISAYLGRSARGRKIADTTAFCDYLLETHFVSAVPGSPFGDDNCIRLSFAASVEELEKGLARLAQALGEFT